MRKWKYFCLALLLLGLPPLHAFGQMVGIATFNRGAATAMPLNASSAQYWNPASITDLSETELDLNIQTYFPEASLGATLPANSIAPGVPPQTLSETEKNRDRFYLAPSIGFVKKFENSRWTLGAVAGGIIGSGVDYPSDDEHPVTSPNIGFGRIQLQGDIYQVAPTVAYRLNSNWSIGVQPSLTVASLKASPFTRVSPDDSNQDGRPTYPSTNRAWAVGAGIQGGVYYHKNNIHLGASIKSPQRLSPFHFKSQNELGQSRNFSTQVELPMILSLGVGYSGIPRMRLAADVRYIDYANAKGLGEAGFTSSGATKGRGWQSTWVVLASAQYRLTQKSAIRANYIYSQLPVQSKYISFNVTSPAIIAHQINIGFAYRIRRNVALGVAYQQGFENSFQGPIQRISGPIPGSSIKLKSGFKSAIVSVIFYFR